MNLQALIPYGYIAASVLFILGLKMLSRPTTARRGNLMSAAGMLLAIVVTLLHQGMSFQWILVGAAIGALIGAVGARLIKMTAMPQMVGLFNGFGGLASLLVGWAEYHRWAMGGNVPDRPLFSAVTIFLTALIGSVTFSGSMIAFGKLSGAIGGKPLLFRGQKILNALLLVLVLVGGAAFCVRPIDSYALFIGILVISLVLGTLAVTPIGGADMPVVIALLNSYSGLAACAAGFVILNNVLIVAGSLVGASGLILTSIMCKSMNRSLANVMFAGVGAVVAKSGDYQGEAKPISAEAACIMLEAADSVVFVPGFGMAVAQAQHVVKELAECLEANGTEVSFVVHPVAGRMPGHMNVLLAEADVAYEQLVEPQDVNPNMPTVDVAVVVGANDVVNPAARSDETSPLYGMPIIDVDRAKVCIVLKRTLNPGFAGVDNPLFFGDNTRMLFGDAKRSLSAMLSEFKSD